MSEQHPQAGSEGGGMRPLILTAAAAFILGLSVGRSGIGRAPDPNPSAVSPSAGAGAALPVFATSPEGRNEPGQAASASGDRPPGGDLARTQGRPAALAVGVDQDPASAAPGNGLQNLVSRLQTRVAELERKLAKLESAQASRTEEDIGARERTEATATAADRRNALVSAGVPNPTAEDLVWRQSAWDLERLELQDQATREGWYRTERYYQALQDLSDEAVDFRFEIGDQAYDRYLFETGENNRVRVTSVIPGSEAELAGLSPGDIIERYDDGRIFSFADLRDATASGDRGALVPILIRRDGQFIEAMLPRGPMGVRIEADSLAPDG